MLVQQVQPWIGKEELLSVSSTIESTWITEGPKSGDFSKKLNELMGANYGVFAPNGTLALYLGLIALGISKDDEVLIPDTTFIASANAVILAGGTPVFVDVNPYNFQIDVSKCDRLLGPRTRAIMPVHLYGMAANMSDVMEFANRNGLLVIEDAAQAVGVRYRGQHTGTFGEIGCFSFFADKTMTTGEGGYIVCQDEDVYHRLMMLRNQGRIDRGTFIHPAVGFNFRITDLQAAIGLVQLAKLNIIIDRKLAILETYRSELKTVEEVRFLKIEPGSNYVPFRVVLICHNAHQLMAYLSEKEVQCRTFFYPLHKQPCFEYLGKGMGGPLNLEDENYSNAVYGYEHGVCLPVFPTMSGEQVRYVCSNIKRFYSK